jgi:hypothetical protein
MFQESRIAAAWHKHTERRLACITWHLQITAPNDAQVSAPYQSSSPHPPGQVHSVCEKL